MLGPVFMDVGLYSLVHLVYTFIEVHSVKHLPEV